ncbi:MAG: CHRD domain-containing protein [Bacteroidetes bacterium]|nr:CHRD domain-containing protein [Bacteroidota bacterium]
MKKQFTTLFYLVLLGILPLSAQIGGNNRLVFVANMDGAQENPATTSDGRGVASFVISEDMTSMTVHGVFSLVTGPITGCHIHTGVVGTNGGVYVNFSNDVIGNELRATVALPADFMAKALGKELYLNVHTANNPGGEIRGQLELQSDVLFATGLTGDQETPAVITDGSGVGYVTYAARDTLARYRFAINGLSGPITASHIHAGVAGSAGGVVVPLTVVSNNLIQGEINLNNVPADFIEKLETEGLYVNVHTAANPGGEIRGQLKSLGAIHFETLMNGDQETPPVTSGAQGVAVAGLSADLTTVNYLVGAYGLVSTAGHFHDGAAGTSGGVLVPFVAAAQPNFYMGSATIPDGMAIKLINSGVYANIHTAANPGGEIRGQMIPALRQVYAFDVCSTQEVPSNNSLGAGAAVITHDWLNTNLDYLYIVDGLTGPPTAAHIHMGAIGVSGGVLKPLNVPMPVGSGQMAINGTFASTLLGGDTYLNVHTAANPGGEIRGQVHLGLLCLVNATDFVSYVSDMTVFPNPAGDEATVRFESAQAFDGQMVLTNITGQQVSSQNINVAVGETSVNISLKNWPTGLYFGQIKSTDGSTLAFKLVKE